MGCGHFSRLLSPALRISAPLAGAALARRFAREAQRLLEAAVSAYGAAHVLCNNPSVVPGSLEMDMWHWRADVDLGTTLAVCRALLPLLAAQEEAHAVNTCAAPGLAGLPAAFSSLLNFYAAVRSGVWGMSENLREELCRAPLPRAAVGRDPLAMADLVCEAAPSPESLPKRPVPHAGQKGSCHTESDL